uniref:DNA annealing helicase and endonuclease ZRANB3 isoform X1 n=1 Tax=Petromyzon marinus TaxID=7757 RepID=A0AAJ7X1J5_PETMA|nr:DNA annealing helicase and endonuclease ZRANB3 isoform X1 [Petromyzon marinus]
MLSPLKAKRRVKAPERSGGSSSGCRVRGGAARVADGGGFCVRGDTQASDGGGGGGSRENANACCTGKDGSVEGEGGGAAAASASGRDVAESDREDAVGGGEDFPELAVLPDKLRQRLMPFQKQGVRFALEKGGRCMIADEMGLGKTIQAIAVAYIYRAEWPMLVVVPSSLKYLWIEELEKWVPELLPGDIHLVENKTDIRAVTESRVTVLGYGLLTADATLLVEALQRRRFQVVLVDESHYMKTRTATRSCLLLPLVQGARRALLLTGTPALARPEELYMQIDALYPNRFGKWTEYAKRYCDARMRFFGRGNRKWDFKGASNLQELHGRLNAFMIRRLKDEVLTQLPPKIRQRIPFDLSKEATRELNTMLDEWEALLKLVRSNSCPTSSFVQVMSLITRLFKQTAVAKAGAVKDYIKMLLENDSIKFLVFAHHLVMLQACTEAVVESKVRYIRIDGSVPAAERSRLVHQFQNDASIRVAVLSIKAAGQGLTFTAATHVVFAELYWDPGHMKQAEDRAHRIGQCSSVHIHYLIAKGTLDSLLWAMINRKIFVTSSTLNGRLEQLGMQEADTDKCDFLSHAMAWVPSDTIPEEEALFFTQREKDKQPDIRGFFKKPTTPRVKANSDGGCDDERENGSVDTAWDARSPPSEEGVDEPADGDGASLDGLRLLSSGKRGVPEGEEFKPQSKKFRLPIAISPNTELQKSRTPPSSASPASPATTSPMALQASPHAGQQTRLPAKSGSASALRRKSTTRRRKDPATQCRPKGPQRGRVLLPCDDREDALAAWDCNVCTYSNNGLMLYCEMCNTVRPSERKTDGEPGDITAGRKKDGTEQAPRGTRKHAAPSPGKSADSEPRACSQAWGECISVSESDDDEDSVACHRLVVEDEVGQTLDPVKPETDGHSCLPPTVVGEASSCAEDGLSGQGSKAGVSVAAGDDATQPEPTSMDVERGAADGEDPCQVDVPAFDSFMFCASRNTDRVFLFTTDGQPLHCNFIPLDIKLENWDELPDILQHKRNLVLVQRFVREWDALPPMKQRILRKSGQVFRSPALAVEEISVGQRKQHCTKRFLSKTDVAERALTTAKQEGGSVRLVTKPGVKPLDRKRDPEPTHGTEKANADKKVPQSAASTIPDAPGVDEVPSVGFLQAVDGSGRPLCLGCSKPTQRASAAAGAAAGSNPGTSAALTGAADWATRFCSRACQEDFNLRSYNSCVRGAVRDAEHGVCRACGLDAQELFSRVRGTPRPQRKALLEATVMAVLSVEQLNEMIREPRAGQFWQADHIQPVWNGGGQCHLDNLQTLCTVCHEKKTNKQEVERRQMVKRAKAAQYGADITLFFQKK